METQAQIYIGSTDGQQEAYFIFDKDAARKTLEPLREDFEEFKKEHPEILKMKFNAPDELDIQLKVDEDILDYWSNRAFYVFIGSAWFYIQATDGKNIFDGRIVRWEELE